jgi:hypothetical protein
MARDAAPTTQRSITRRRLERADKWFLIDALLFTYLRGGTNGKMQEEIGSVPKSDRPMSVFP